MSKGENIFKRKDGRWEARYIRDRELSGKILYGYCYGKTYREAKEKAEKCRAAVQNGALPRKSGARHRLEWYCDEWLRQGKPKRKESTNIKYESILKKHIKPRLGSCYPAAMDSGVLADFSEALSRDAGLAPKTVRDVLMVLRSVLKFAAKQYPGGLPQVEISYPRVPRKDMRVLTEQEQKDFTAYLMTDVDPCKFGILLALFTGMRVGEVCALRWENISLQDKTIRINATMQRLKDVEPQQGKKTKITITAPKSNTSQRIIPMTESIAQLCRKMDPGDGNAFVLTGYSAFMEPRTLQYRLEKYTKACNLEGVHFHTLRHTFATRCVEVGFEIKSLSEILGHSSTTITLDRYVHSSLELKRSNMEKLPCLEL